MPTIIPTYPKLRPVSAQLVQHLGASFWMLTDSILSRSLLVPRELGPLLALCNGEWHQREWLSVARSRYGLEVSPEVAMALLERLHESCFLEGEVYQAAMQQAREEYQNAPSRRMLGKAAGNPTNARTMRHFLDRKFAAVPGFPSPVVFRAMLSPHIDYDRGSATYASIFHLARKSVAAASLVILIGTDHFGGVAPFTLTRQNYATPFGIVPTDQEIVEKLGDALGASGWEGELYHQGEHSIELPLNWLHGIRPDNPPRLVPILCSTLGAEEGLATHPQLQALLAVLRPYAQQPDTLVVASGDLSHMGPAFGGEPLSATDRRVIAQEDEQLLHLVRAADPTDFYHHLAARQNRNNVCGWIPIYTTLALTQPSRGEVIGYQQCPADSVGTSIVSIAGAAFS